MNGGSPNAQAARCEPEAKVCAACGGQFSCAARAAGCWCEEVKLTNQALNELRGRFADCLCPRCLSAASAQRVRNAE
jgi:hypothetical protein